MPLRWSLVALSLAAGSLAGGCGTLTAEPTPVPGAAATMARAAATAIPTRAAAAPVPSPAASPLPSPSPMAASLQPASEVTDAQVDALRQRFADVLATAPALTGLEDLFLDRVSLSTPEGGQVLDREAMATWLRERADDSLRVERVDRSALAVLLQVGTQDWPTDRQPLRQGRVSFNLHRYNAAGALDDVNGEWKVDVVIAE